MSTRRATDGGLNNRSGSASSTSSGTSTFAVHSITNSSNSSSDTGCESAGLNQQRSFSSSAPNLLRSCFKCANSGEDYNHMESNNCTTTSKNSSSSSSSNKMFRSNHGVLEDIQSRLTQYIQRGDVGNVERLLCKHKQPSEIVLTVKRRHLKPNFNQWSNSDPFLHFYQECSPIIWAVDCQQWLMLPLLGRFGIDPNRPIYCRRWTVLGAASQSRHFVNGTASPSPYKGFWTRGKYTYQSALDYYFASIYEFLAEDMQRLSAGASAVASPFTYYFQQLPILLSKSVDVHRIDSVIIFNALAYSFDWFLSRYTNELCTVPDIPESTGQSLIEVQALRDLISNGFSQFECMEFISSCHNWFGLLFCLLCHPKLEQYGEASLPPIICSAALLLINLLSMRCQSARISNGLAQSSDELFEENLESLQLRKLYVKRYTERRHDFMANLRQVQRACAQFHLQPQSLRGLSRCALRLYLGSTSFQKRLKNLHIPQEMKQFVAYIEVDHLKQGHFPKLLQRLASGENIYSSEAVA